MKLHFNFIFVLCILFYGCSEVSNEPEAAVQTSDSQKQSAPIEISYPAPTASQLEWQNSEMVMFIHFGMNTFTDKEWGDGTEDPKLFNPTNLDARQWVEIAKEIGFKYIILTAKHHDGFCLWPSKYTEHSIKNSNYKNGKGDIVKEFADACHKAGMKFSFYLSPWDRHEKSYGTEEYNDFYIKQLTELLTNYGDVGEVWLDNANGEGPEGKKQDYAWDLIYSTIRFYQPNALIAVSGPDIRWIGNEKGIGYETEWCVQSRSLSIQPADYLNRVWYPSECDVSIRPGWFYHASENQKIKSADDLVNLYLLSVGRNSNLLLNVCPDKQGRFCQEDIQRLREWKAKLKSMFSTNVFKGQKIQASNIRKHSEEDYLPGNCLDGNINTFWATDRKISEGELTIILTEPRNINVIRLEEAIKYGQRICAFELFYESNDEIIKFFEGSTIGRSRIIRFDKIYTSKIIIKLKATESSPAIREIQGFYSESI